MLTIVRRIIKNDLSIRVRLAFLISIFTILPTLAIVSFTIFTLQNTLRNEIISSNRFQMQWANQFVDDLVLKADAVFNTIRIYPDLDENLLKTGDQNAETQLASYTYMKDLLNVFYYSNSVFIDRLSVGSKAGLKSFAIDSSIQWVINESGESKPWEDASLYFERSGNSVTVYRAIKRFEDRQTIGYMSIRLNETVTSQLQNILQIDADSTFFMLDDTNKIILSGGKATDFNAFDQLDFEEPLQSLGKDFVFTTTLRGGDLKLIKLVPQTMVSQNTGLILLAGIFISLGFVGLAIYLSTLFSTRITKPIISLANTMRSVDIEAFKLREIDDQNEIGLLETGYNNLMVRTKTLIDQEYKRELELKNAQLKALQAQINPHFLYNILQMVGGIALAHNVEEIHSITNTISDLFRYSISKTGDLVTLGDEVAHIKNYLYIQKLRFGDRISMEVTIDEATQHYAIPKFTLQPLVENAFEHGLHQKTKGGQLKVTLRDQTDHLEITVWDNGEGMSPQLVDALEEHLAKPKTLSDEAAFGIGIKNVDARLKLIFGSSYALIIRSEAGHYTEIVVSIPKTSPGETHDETDPH
jgi:two-component system, sensor histidine kinase YesM